jgi:prefoldin subunit 5
MDPLLQAVINQVVIWFTGRLNALKNKIAVVQQDLGSLQGQFTQFTQSITTAIQDRYTKSESDARYLGKTETAVNSDKLGGSTLQAVLAAAAMDASSKADALRETVQKDTVIIPLVNGSTYSLETILGANFGHVDGDGTVVVEFNGDFGSTGILNKADGQAATQAIKTNDKFVVKMLNGAVVSVQYVPSAVKAAIDGLFSEIVVLDSRVDAVEANISTIQTDYATKAFVKAEDTNAWTYFRDALYNSGYTDPN